MRSLRSRLVAGTLVGLAALLLAADTAIYTVQRRQLYAAFDATLLASADALALLVHPGPRGIWFDTAGLVRLTAGELRAGAHYQIWSDEPIDIPGPPGAGDPEFGPGGPPPPPPDGALEDWWEPPPDEPRGHSRGRRPRGEPPPGTVRTRVIRSEGLGEKELARIDTLPGHPRFERVTLPDGRVGRAVGVRFSVAPPPNFRTPPANLAAVVAAPTADVEAQLGFLRILLGATVLGTLAMATGVAWLVVTRGLRPLDRVASRIAALDAAALKQRIGGEAVPREVEPLVTQLNAMLGRLDEAFERERALTADVAHELRTPVAEIRAIVEVTLNRSRTEGEYRRALTETLEVARALQGLIEKLLVLARLEAGQLRPDLQPVPLEPFLREHWTELSQRAAARGVSCDLQVAGELVASADPQLLGVVLTNALGNAVAYAPEGSRITVAGGHTAAGVGLEIANMGCVIAPGDVSRVFDRFWRADHARGGAGLSCGLGLTLVRRAMQAMAGVANARVDEGGRFVLGLTFAAAGDAAQRGDFASKFMSAS